MMEQVHCNVLSVEEHKNKINKYETYTWHSSLEIGRETSIHKIWQEL